MTASPALRVAMSLLAVVLGCLSRDGLAAQTTPLSVTLSSDYREVLPGVPVVVSVAIANVSNEPQPVPARVEPDFGFVRYVIRFGAGAPQDFKPWAQKETLGRPESLPPGQVKAGVARIFFGDDGWTFARPGKYEIEAIVGNARSNPVTLTVRAPKSAEERQQADLMLNEEVGYFLLLDGGDHLKQGLSRLQALREQYPGSELAAHATLAIGISLSRDYADFARGQVRVANLSESARLLELSAKSDAARESGFLRVTSTSRLAAVLDRLGQTERARLTREMLQKEATALTNRLKELKVFEAMRDKP